MEWTRAHTAVGGKGSARADRIESSAVMLRASLHKNWPDRLPSQWWIPFPPWLGLLVGLVSCCPLAAADWIVFTQVPTNLPADAVVKPAGRTPADPWDQARLVRWSPEKGLQRLAPDFAAACDPDVSFDGKRLLFAGKKRPDSTWAVWEMNIEDGRVWRVTQAPDDCRQPIYLSSLFTLDSPEPWYTIAYVGVDTAWTGSGPPVTSLYSIRLDGRELRQITFHPRSDVDPFQMQDSRLIFAGFRSPRLGRVPAPEYSLFGLNIDGTELELYGGEQGKAFQRMPCATPDGEIVFVESDCPGTDGAGQLGGIMARRPHHSYRRLTQDPEFAYLYPQAFTNGTLLVSRRPAHPGGNSGVFCLHLGPQAGDPLPLFDSPRYHDLQAKLLRPRPEPDGRSTVVNLSHNTGLLYALNCYDLDPLMESHVRPGEIKRLRVIEGFPAPAPASLGQIPPLSSPRPGSGHASSPRMHRRIVGVVPIEPDGSCKIEVPADIPLELQALDETGLALATCGWIWVKQKENRGCIGCHEDPELLPENAFVGAMRRPARALTLPPEKRRVLGFRQHIAPVLRNKCALGDCHGGQDTPLFMALGRTAAEESQLYDTYVALLAAPPSVKRPAYVESGRARNSFLIWQILGRNTSRPWDPKPAAERSPRLHRMPPPDRAPPLAAAEVQLLIEWIDLGAPWTAVPAPAQSTTRPEP